MLGNTLSAYARAGGGGYRGGGGGGEQADGRQATSDCVMHREGEGTPPSLGEGHSLVKGIFVVKGISASPTLLQNASDAVVSSVIFAISVHFSFTKFT